MIENNNDIRLIDVADEAEKVEVLVGDIDRVSWVREKQFKITRSLANLNELLKSVIESDSENIISNEIEDRIEASLNVINLFNTQMTLVMHGFPMSYTSEDYVDSLETLKELYERYEIEGSRLEPSLKAIKAINEENKAEIIKLLTPENIGNRQEVFELCRKMKYEDEVIKGMKDDIEEVTQGNMPWNEFCMKYIIELK